MSPTLSPSGNGRRPDDPSALLGDRDDRRHRADHFAGRSGGSAARWFSLVCLALTSLAAAGAPAAPAFDGATPVEWSLRLGRSELARRGTSLEFNGAPKARWDYTSGLFALALMRLGETTGDAALAEAGARIVTSYVADDGSIRTYQRDEYNLDMVTPGRALLRWHQAHPEPRYQSALAHLRAQLAEQPRTSDGGFWHKQRYPYQMWLDGLYMAAPFYAAYANATGEQAALDDVARQVLLADSHLYDVKTGLYHHAWDEKRQQSWADRQTGRSPHFWGRAIGWYGMAVVDVLDELPPTHPEVEAVNEVLRRVAAGLLRWQDAETGVWWQIVDQPGRKGNYREASVSCMATYILAKGINRGYLPRDRYLPAVQRAYAGLLREFIRTSSGGDVSLTRVCEVAGLGYTTASGRPRDGSFDYYVSEPVIDNDLKGVGPFILAGLEVQRALTASADHAAVRGWEDLDRMLARIVAPTFPEHDFVITRFGARPGEDAGDAIRAAIAACHEAGGGRVVIPAGEWQTGPIHLRSRVNLHVARDATLRFDPNPARYLPAVPTRWEGVECHNYSPLIYAYEQEDIAVTGEGTLDGGATWETWWSWNNKQDAPPKQRAARDRLLAMGQSGTPVAERVFGAGDFLRPSFIQPHRCRNVLIEGVTIVRSPMWEIHPLLCSNVTVRKVRIDSHGPNNDGCDPESCRDVLIEGCEFDTGDDCIAIKSGRNNDGRRVNVPTENLVIRDCTMKDGHGGVVLGSECSGGIRNVFVERCRMDSPNLDRALRFKSNAERGGVLENVFLRDVTIGRVAEAVLTIDLLYEEGPRGSHPPVIRNVQLERVTSSGSPRVLFVRGFAGATIDGLQLRDCVFNSVTEGDVVEHAGRITFQRVSVIPAKIPRGLNSVPPPAR